jgi:hypothetical protein
VDERSRKLETTKRRKGKVGVPPPQSEQPRRSKLPPFFVFSSFRTFVMHSTAERCRRGSRCSTPEDWLAAGHKKVASSIKGNMATTARKTDTIYGTAAPASGRGYPVAATDLRARDERRRSEDGGAVCGQIVNGLERWDPSAGNWPGRTGANPAFPDRSGRAWHEWISGKGFGRHCG